jgi:dTMP kinase
MSFIVLEGLDGAGKSTQIRLLQEALGRRGQAFEYLHFPRFDTPIYGELIARFLRGELGAVDAVNPYLVALIYAGDRQQAAPLIRRWLSEGKTVIVDRYVASNIAYQCAKLTDPAEKATLGAWIRELEYDRNEIPKPDITLFLDVPFAFTQKSLAQNRAGDDREYLRGKADIHEASLDLQQAVRQVYLDQAEVDPLFRVIDCAAPDGGMLPPAEAFERIEEAISHI